MLKKKKESTKSTACFIESPLNFHRKAMFQEKIFYGKLCAEKNKKTHTGGVNALEVNAKSEKRRTCPYGVAGLINRFIAAR